MRPNSICLERKQKAEQGIIEVAKTHEIKVALRVSKPPHELFRAIVDPVKMSNYFISRGSGRLEEGKQIMWRFPEWDIEFSINVRRIEKDSYVSYTWQVDGEDLLAEMTLTAVDSRALSSPSPDPA